MEGGGELETNKRTNPGLRTVVVGIGNQKGGVGKTTVTVNLARALVERGRRVLVMDMDINAGSTKCFGIEAEAFLGTFEMLVDDEDPLDVALSSNDDEVNLPEGLFVISGGRKLQDLENRLREKTSKFANLNDRLKPILEKIRGHFDYVLLDTPPNAPLPAVLAYTASDYFLLVAIPEGLAIEGLAEALHDIKEARDYGHAHVDLLGIVLGAVDRRTRLSRELVAYVEREFGPDYLQPVIKRSTIIPTSQTNHTTIFDTDPDHEVTHQFRELAAAFEKRVDEKSDVPRLALPMPGKLPRIDDPSEERPTSGVAAEAANG